MRKCPFCQAEIEDDAVFCGECGARLTDTEPAAADAQAAGPQGPAYETVFCPNCGAQNTTEFAYCQNCGAPLQENGGQTYETVFCPNCGAQNTTEFAYCQNCGAALSDGTAPASGAAVAGKKRKIKLPLLLGAAVIVLVAALFLLLRGGSGGDKPRALYIKDKELFYSELSKDDPLEVTSRMFDDADVTAQDFGYISFYGTITFNENKTRLFFPDKISDTDEGATIYYRDINKPKQEAERVDTDIVAYAINNAGTCVVYVKGEDGVLYKNDFKDKEKIASEVTFFATTEDCKKVLYLTEDETLYLWENGEKDKLASDVTYVNDVLDDLSCVYYERDDALYSLKLNGGDPEKIDSDIYNVIAIYEETGEVFYLKEDVLTCNVTDYVNDDMADSDAALTAPQYPYEPYRFLYDSEAEYEAAYKEYQEAYANYQTAYEEYSAKLTRDYLRSDMEDATFELSQYSLYYYDGKDSEKITDTLTSSWDYDCAADTAVVAYCAYSDSDSVSVKISDMESVWDVEQKVRDAQKETAEGFVYAGGESMPFEAEEPEELILSNDGKTLYFLDNVSEKNIGDLYKAAVRGSSVDSPEEMDTEVDTAWLGFTGGDKLFYYKNFDRDSYKADLYIDGNEVDYDVRMYSMTNHDDTVLYYTDWNSDKEYGTLMRYKNGESTKVSDDVHACMYVEDELLYIKDFSVNSYRGTLSVYNNGKPKDIDDDVSVLLPNYNLIGGSHYV